MRQHVSNSSLTFARRPCRRRVVTYGLALMAASAALPRMAHAAPKVITAPEAYKAAKSGDLILVDIRTPEEWRQTGVGEGAIALDMRAPDFVQKLVDLRKTYPDKPIAMICHSGSRSTYVTSVLDKQGFPNLINVAEGMGGGPNGKGWVKQGLPTYPGSTDEITARLKAVLKPTR